MCNNVSNICLHYSFTSDVLNVLISSKQLIVLIAQMLCALLFAWHNCLKCKHKKIPPPEVVAFFHFFHKRLRIFNRFLTHLLYVPIFAGLQIFIQLCPTLTKLCHIKRDCLVHVICSKCPPLVETHAFRRLHKSLTALLIVVSGKSL